MVILSLSLVFACTLPAADLHFSTLDAKQPAASDHLRRLWYPFPHHCELSFTPCPNNRLSSPYS